MTWQRRLAQLLLRDALPPTPQLTMIGFGQLGGVNPYGVSESSTLGLSAVYRAVTIIASAVASLPVGEWRGTTELTPSRLVLQPSQGMTRRAWVWRVTASLALHNTAHALKAGRDSEGVPLSLLLVPPQAITPQYAIEDMWRILPPSSYRIGQREFEPDEILSMQRAVMPSTSPELSGLLELARSQFATALAAEGYASRYWQAGGQPTTVITTEQELEGTQADDLAGRWRDRRAQGPDYPAVLGKGASAEPYGADPTTASAVESRRELVADIARLFGVPTAMMNAPAGDPMTYRTTESEGLAFIRYTLADYIGTIEDALSGLLPGGRQVRLNTTQLTRGEQLTRFQAWQSALAAGWLTVDEVREAEGLGPLETSTPAVESPQGAPELEVVA